MTVRILVGDARAVLATLPAESVHMVWTSPPYWGLRAYGTEPQVWGGVEGCEHEWGASGRSLKGSGGTKSFQTTNAGSLFQGNSGCFCPRCGAWRGEHGLESTLGLWLEHEVEVWRAVRRVLRQDGTVWLNCGDAYAASKNGRPVTKDQGDDRAFRDKSLGTVGSFLKPKDRIGLPHRLVFALQADGWWWRDEVVWHKRNSMPSSVRDRTTPAHEFVFVLTRSPRYYYDQLAIAEPAVIKDGRKRVYGGVNKHGANVKDGGRTQGRTWHAPRGWDTAPGSHGTIHRQGREAGESGAVEAAPTRRKRSVWPLATEPFPEAHFATAPTGLVRPCVLAGSSAKGVCPRCGAPWKRETTTAYENPGNRSTNGPRSLERRHETPGFPVRLKAMITSVGWSPSCRCVAEGIPDFSGDAQGVTMSYPQPVPATVLDPFGGAGTTGLVAEELGRDSILIELKPEYAEMARARIRRKFGDGSVG